MEELPDVVKAAIERLKHNTTATETMTPHEAMVLTALGYSVERGMMISNGVKTTYVYYITDPNYINFGDLLVRSRLNMQCQYAARYIEGWGDYEYCGLDLRIILDKSSYHFHAVHKDDAEELINRIRKAIGPSYNN